jgi:hypothetical protein
VAGAVTGLFTVWAFIALFTGAGEYLTAFVAQYSGAGRPERIGPAVWQGIYFSLGAGLLLAALSPLCAPVFALAGHDPNVRTSRSTCADPPHRGAFPWCSWRASTSSRAAEHDRRPPGQPPCHDGQRRARLSDSARRVSPRGGRGRPGRPWFPGVGGRACLWLILRPRFREEYGTLRGGGSRALLADSSATVAERSAVLARWGIGSSWSSSDASAKRWPRAGSRSA